MTTQHHVLVFPDRVVSLQTPPLHAAERLKPYADREGHEPPLRLLTRGAEKASPAEVADNPRAASVRLRAVERVRPSTGAAA